MGGMNVCATLSIGLAKAKNTQEQLMGRFFQTLRYKQVDAESKFG
jgi:hypothetical protein